MTIDDRELGSGAKCPQGDMEEAGGMVRIRRDLRFRSDVQRLCEQRDCQHQQRWQRVVERESAGGEGHHLSDDVDVRFFGF